MSVGRRFRFAAQVRCLGGHHWLLVDAYGVTVLRRIPKEYKVKVRLTLQQLLEAGVPASTAHVFISILTAKANIGRVPVGANEQLAFLRRLYPEHLGGSEPCPRTS